MLDHQYALQSICFTINMLYHQYAVCRKGFPKYYYTVNRHARPAAPHAIDIKMTATPLTEALYCAAQCYGYVAALRSATWFEICLLSQKKVKASKSSCTQQQIQWDHTIPPSTASSNTHRQYTCPAAVQACFDSLHCAKAILDVLFALKESENQFNARYVINMFYRQYAVCCVPWRLSQILFLHNE